MKMYMVKITNMEKEHPLKKVLKCFSKQSDDQIKWFL